MNMPTMPTMPTMKNNDSVEESKTSLPGAIETEVTPEEDEVKIIDPSKTNSDIKVPNFPKGGIEVEATGKGFYNQRRLVAGDKFKLRSKKWGTWFKCLDPVMEKERVNYLKEKKEKAKAKK